MSAKRQFRIGLALERESIFARRLLEGMAAEAAVLSRAGTPLDLRFLHDRLLRDRDEMESFDAFVAQIQDAGMAAALKAARRPFVDVLMLRRFPGARVVNVDNEAIASAAVEHFVSRRFTEFAFCGRSGVAYSDERRGAFAALLRKRGFPCRMYDPPKAAGRALASGGARRKGEAVDEPADARSLEKWAASLKPGTAVFCCQDLRAYQLMRACRTKGVRVPQDVAVLGVDDDPLFCSFTDPKLSSVDPNAEDVGREAVRALAESLRRTRGRTAARDVFVKPRGVTVRESTDVYRVDHPWLGKALEFIHRDPAACITAADVFAHVGLSHTIVDREFRSKLGTSVQKEIMKARLDRAAELLANTSIPVAEVAERSGFASFPYFCSSFSSRFRTTAVRYRELQKKKTKLHN